MSDDLRDQIARALRRTVRLPSDAAADVILRDVVGPALDEAVREGREFGYKAGLEVITSDEAVETVFWRMENAEERAITLREFHKALTAAVQAVKQEAEDE